MQEFVETGLLRDVGKDDRRPVNESPCGDGPGLRILDRGMCRPRSHARTGRRLLFLLLGGLLRWSETREENKREQGQNLGRGKTRRDSARSLKF